MDDKDSVIINPRDSSSAEKYYCSSCNTQLIPFTQEDMKGAYICTNCTIEYWPSLEQVKKSNKFDLPGPSTDLEGNVTRDKDIPIASVDNVNRNLSTTTYGGKKKLPAAYEALKKAGFKFTSFEER